MDEKLNIISLTDVIEQKVRKEQQLGFVRATVE